MFQESRQSGSKRKSHTKSYAPVTHSSIKHHTSIVEKRYQSVKGKSKVELTYSSKPSPEFVIKIIDPLSFTVAQLELTNQFLSEGDPAVFATFENVEAMYTQFCEILRIQPVDFEICQNGTIKVHITVSMKSSIRKRQLVLQTQVRSMSETERLKLIMQQQQQNQEKEMKILTQQQEAQRKTITQLTQRTAKLEKQLQQAKQQNLDLKKIIYDLKHSTKAEVEQIKHKINKQREQTQNILSQLRQSVEQVRQGMNRMNFSVKLLMSGSQKIHLTLDTRNKCLMPDSKQNSFSVNAITQQNEQFTKLTKIGKDKWCQVLFQYAINHHISYFEFEVVKTKNNYICVGIGNQSCLQQQDSKWSKTSITLFLLDRSIICQGKTVQNSSLNTSNSKIENHSNYSSVKSIKSNSQIITHNVRNCYRVVVNLQNKTIAWFENQTIIGTTAFSQQYLKLCKGNEIKPLLICSDQDDQIILK